MPLHLVGISNNTIWHTIRHAATPTTAGSWEPWDNVSISAGPLSGAFDIACAFVGGRLHMFVTTSPAGLFHTIRTALGAWQPWGDAGAAAFSQVYGISHVDCAQSRSGLDVCVSGFRKSGQVAALDAVHCATRISTPTSWTQSGEVTGRYTSILDVACANVGGALHVLARCLNGGGPGLLAHNILLAGGGQQPLGDQNVFPIFPNTGALGATRTVAAAGIGPQLHVIASDGTELFHTIRLNNVAWQTTFGLVRPAVSPMFAGPLAHPACANDGGNLHVCAISTGSIMHTIRLSNPAAWRNPETAADGRFGDVLNAVPRGPGSAVPARTFSSIACAGE